MMKFALAMMVGALAMTPLAPAAAADVLVSQAAKPKAEAAPQPQRSVSEPLFWAILLVAGVGLLAAAANRRAEPQIRIRFD